MTTYQTEFEGFTFEKSSLFTMVFSTENDRNRYISVVSDKKSGRLSFGRKKVSLQKVSSLRSVEK